MSVCFTCDFFLPRLPFLIGCPAWLEFEGLLPVRPACPGRLPCLYSFLSCLVCLPSNISEASPSKCFSGVKFKYISFQRPKGKENLLYKILLHIVTVRLKVSQELENNKLMHELEAHACAKDAAHGASTTP
jgi:hypothetical protein